MTDIQSAIESLVQEEVDQVIEDKIEEHHKVEDIDSRVASIEERFDALIQAIEDHSTNEKLLQAIKNI
tara:strand:- start:250 stop:453 length:204 start_codon:yes stop_codon:yes gene_type:complete